VGPAAPRGSRIVVNRPLTAAEDAVVDGYLSSAAGAATNEVINQIVRGSDTIPVTREGVLRLRPGKWLNDEVVNFFLELLKARSATNDELPQCHIFNTHFYRMLSGRNGNGNGCGYNYADVRRWMHEVDVFAKDMLICPIHCHGNHWTLALVNFCDKRIEYYDSLSENPSPAAWLANLRHYLKDEHLRKHKTTWDDAGWTDHVWRPSLHRMPQQLNDWDCGMFMCKTVDYLSQDAKLNFSQDDMPYFRRRFVIEIHNKALLDQQAWE